MKFSVIVCFIAQEPWLIASLNGKFAATPKIPSTFVKIIFGFIEYVVIFILLCAPWSIPSIPWIHKN